MENCQGWSVTEVCLKKGFFFHGENTFMFNFIFKYVLVQLFQKQKSLLAQRPKHQIQSLAVFFLSSR